MHSGRQQRSQFPSRSLWALGVLSLFIAGGYFLLVTSRTHEIGAGRNLALNAQKIRGNRVAPPVLDERVPMFIGGVDGIKVPQGAALQVDIDSRLNAYPELTEDQRRILTAFMYNLELARAAALRDADFEVVARVEAYEERLVEQVKRASGVTDAPPTITSSSN
jgi:hypothetical protein